MGGMAPPPPPERPSRTGTALLVSVFLLSAAVGGGMAGLLLALNSGGSEVEAPAVAEAGPPVPSPVPERGSAAVLSKRAPVAASAASDATETPAAPADGAASPRLAAPATGKDEERLVARPAPSAPPERTSAAPARGAEEAAIAGGAELKQLTEHVVAALGALNAAPEEKDIAQVEADAERLRNSLAELVSAALTQGKSEAEVRELVSAALDEAGEGNIPGILRDASGKVNLQRLLASIMPGDAARDMPMTAQERSYFDLLEEEAGATALTDTPGQGGAPATPRAPDGRFFFENGKRYTIVRRGDTLSDIAFAAYGDVLAYPAILRANRGRISTRRLKPGTRIVIPDIPRKARKRRSAAPVSLIRRATRQTRKTAPAGDRLLARKRAGGATEQEAAEPAGVKNVITNFRPARLKAEQPGRAPAR